MQESLGRHYLKEEAFLDDLQDVAYAAARVLRGDWQPDSACDDRTRDERDEVLSSGRLEDLVFQSAAVYDDPNGAFSSAQILLKSSKRVVSVRVRKVNGNLVAEKAFDKPAAL